MARSVARGPESRACRGVEGPPSATVLPDDPPISAPSGDEPGHLQPATVLANEVPKVQIDINDKNTLGQQVVQLVNGEIEAGYHEITFNASDLPSAVYFYRLQSGSFTEAKKLLLVR